MFVDCYLFLFAFVWLFLLLSYLNVVYFNDLLLDCRIYCDILGFVIYRLCFTLGLLLIVWLFRLCV